MSSVINRFNQIVAAQPNKVALNSEQEQLTYQQLNHRATLVAQSLVSQGLSGQLVVLHFPSSIELVVSILGVLKAGGTYVCLDTAYPQQRKQYILDKSQSRAVITRHPLDLAVELTLDYSLLLLEPLHTVPAHIDPSPIMNVIFTSGSTGEPKGVKLSHTNILSFIDTHGDIVATDCMPQLSSIAFDAFQFELWVMLLNGGTLCLLPEKTLLNAPALKQAIERHQITMAFVTTALVNLGVLNHFIHQPTIRRLYFGGEELKSNAIKHDFPDYDFELVHCYGPSETSVWNVSYHCQQWEATLPLGNPLSNSTLLLVDQHGQAITTPNQIGEIYIGGPCVSEGYLHDDHLSQQSFRVIDGTRYFKTSDMAMWNADAQLVYSHRIGNTVKHNGYRINLNEIDRAIQSCDNQVQSVTTQLNGELATFYCQTQLDELAIRHRLNAILPAYMCPTHIVKVAQFPLTPHGKIDVQALHHHLNERQCYTQSSEDSADLILTIWRKLLGNPAIDLDDRYFECGGNSVLLLKLQRELNKQFSLNVKVSDLFAHTTVSEQAELIDSLIEQ
ncbi:MULTISPECIES: non-ribosomal peptide synthetase [unclassified Vibrio]|uniref:non-ribosomal peptide synthetase n=1 Tax=unclassified Vibrio TaxID=2614977 RepID=UPI001482E4F8|nr:MULTISPECIES: non-ribosomal peptide synthetase [unclassified Vibrio]MDQ2189947.1 non-ribosomal peptide synthetase [Vibrio sp. A14(2019)]MDQ2195861.1 non-ribosomal peptide synthetase [Vibrio sp. 2017_1457_11]NNN74692.1 non-ribosomal peptide synthetase [Vibrio sp. B7]NNN91601.1 non-ribosomal peptide synthetase [Vibrio sp. B8-1]NNO06783.1 non-ribosomal peptide synthetase [Vibrio sp. B4-12]